MNLREGQRRNKADSVRGYGHQQLTSNQSLDNQFSIDSSYEVQPINTPLVSQSRKFLNTQLVSFQSQNERNNKIVDRNQREQRPRMTMVNQEQYDHQQVIEENAKQTIIQLKEQLNKAESQINKITYALIKEKQSLQKSNEYGQFLQQKIEDLEAKDSQLRSFYRTFEREKTELVKRMEKQQTQIKASFLKQLNDKNQEINNATIKLKKIQLELSQQRTKCQQLTNEIVIKDQLHQTSLNQQSLISAVIEQKQNELYSLRQKLSEAKSEITKQRERIQERQSQTKVRQFFLLTEQLTRMLAIDICAIDNQREDKYEMMYALIISSVENLRTQLNEMRNRLIKTEETVEALKKERVSIDNLHQQKNRNPKNVELNPGFNKQVQHRTVSMINEQEDVEFQNQDNENGHCQNQQLKGIEIKQIDQLKKQIDKEKTILKQQQSRIFRRQNQVKQQKMEIKMEINRIEQQAKKLKQQENRLVQQRITISKQRTQIAEQLKRMETQRKQLQTQKVIIDSNRNRLRQEINAIDREKKQIEQIKKKIEADKLLITQHRSRNQQQIIQKQPILLQPSNPNTSFIVSSILQGKQPQRLFLLSLLQQHIGPIRNTFLLFKQDKYQRNFMVYILQSTLPFLALIKAKHDGNIFGVYTNGLNNSNTPQFSFLFSLTNQHICLPRANNQVPATSYDNVYLTFGNKQFRIRNNSQSRIVNHNFKVAGRKYYLVDNSQRILGSRGYQNQVEFEELQIHSIVFDK